MSYSNSSKISALRFKCHGLEIFRFEFLSQFTASHTIGHQIKKIYPFFSLNNIYS